MDLSYIANWNISNVENMEGMFEHCSNITSIDSLSNWNTSNVNNMSRLFLQVKMTNLDSLSNWNVSNVTKMSYMFAYCTSIIDASGINNWNINNVVYTSGINSGFYRMFKDESNIYPVFTKRAGTWDSEGSFIPNA